MVRRLAGTLAAAMLLLLSSCALPLSPAEDTAGPSPVGTADAGRTETVLEQAAPEQTVPAPEQTAPAPEQTAPAPEQAAPVREDGVYTARDDVALYIHTYGHLPGNFITKREARDLGWEGGSLEPWAPGKCIGGDRFGNYEGLLPAGGSYRECDIGTLGASGRGAERIVYSDDGGIWYTGDHYASFEQLYQEGSP